MTFSSTGQAQLLQPSASTTTSITVSWTVEAGSFDDYVLQYRPEGGTPSSPIIVPANSPRIQTVSNLEPGSLYTFILSTVQNGENILSDTLEAYTSKLNGN